MRRHGLLDRVSGFGVSDHVCWEYTSDDGFLEPGLAWVAEGLSLGQRVMYLADRPVAQMVDDLRPLGAESTRARERGALIVGELSDIVPNGGPVQPESQLDAYDAVTKQAVREGYEGVRVLAEVTSLVRQPAWRDEHARWEQLADHYMVDNPLAAFCAYDLRALGDEATAAIACVHPLRRRRARGAAFSLFATEDGLFLEGDIDTFKAPLLDRALGSRPRADLVLTVGEGSFLDAAATSVIARHAETAMRRGTRVAITMRSDTLTRLWDLLGFERTVPLANERR